MPRTTSHSVWPSATTPVPCGGGAPAAPLASALACRSTGRRHAGDSRPRRCEIFAVTALFGVSGGVSIEMLRMNIRLGRENQSASLRTDRARSNSR